MIVCVFTPMLPGLEGQKMSASETKNKIDLLDTIDEVIRKVNSAYCIPGDMNNSILPFIKYVIFPLKQGITIERDKKFGGKASYKDYRKLESDFVNKKLHPADLKNAVSREINLILKHIHKQKAVLDAIDTNKLTYSGVGFSNQIQVSIVNVLFWFF